MTDQHFTSTAKKVTQVWLPLLVLGWLAPLVVGCQTNNNVVVVTSDYTPADEIGAMTEMMTEWDNEPCVVALSELSKADTDWADCVIYHRSDTTNITTEEAEVLAEVLLPYVEGGGALLLTMEATRLLNEWGIEPQPLEVVYEDARDHGYGRPLGYHGYREHPIYEGLLGGAYVWKSDADHWSRTLGFSGDNLPQAEGARVLGINWAYIHYHEGRKIVWETPLGKGKILAIGGHLFFGRKNLNKTTLEIFFDNTIDWLCGGRRFDSAERAWSYDSIKAQESNYTAPAVKIKQEPAWEPTPDELAGYRKCTRANYWNISGQQIVAFGREQGGVEEVWAHPIMALRDLSFGVKYKGDDQVVWLDGVAGRMVRTADYMERRYELEGGVVVSEVFNVLPEEPLMTVNYSWTEGDGEGQIESVRVKYASNLRLMWPYSLESTGTLYYSTDQGGAVTVICDRAEELNVVTAFTTTPTAVEKSVGDGHKIVNMGYSFPADEGRLTLYIAGGESGVDQSVGLINRYMGHSQRVYRQSKEYYDHFAKDFLSIESSDAEFNKAYRWNLISLDKFFCHTPSLGKSLMAGFWSTSRGWGGGHPVSGRPGYAWYFGRDCAFSSLALVEYGDYVKVRDILTTFGRFQDPNGKVYHELTTSGSAHYDAADATPLYILLSGYYLRKSGDREFVEAEWPRIKKSLEFCLSTDTDGDGLIENTNVGHGLQEGGPLYGAHTEVYLAAIWISALGECEQMARMFGDDALADECKTLAAKCQAKMDEGFWNDQLEFYNHGLMRDGTYQEDKCIYGCTPLFFGLADEERALKTALNFSDKYYSTDWGVRTVGTNSRHFALGGYNYGNVWPFTSGLAATAEYRAGLLSQGFRHAYSALRLYDCWDYGNLPEVIMGDRLDFTGICPHQQWSSSLNLYPLYVGMLGLETEGLGGKMTLAPAFPADWSWANVENISVGENKVNLRYERTEDHYRYELNASGRVEVDFVARLPLATVVDGVWIDGRRVEECEVAEELQCVAVELPRMALRGAKEIEVAYRGGVGVMLNLPEAKIGMADRGVKINRESYNPQSHHYTLALAGVAEQAYDIELLTLSEVQSVEGGEVVSRSGDKTTIRVVMPVAEEGELADLELVVRL